MSNLLELYSKSPFSSIGNKVSSIQSNKIPTSGETNKFNTKSILEIQKDFTNIVAVPYKTILLNHSKVGDIQVNPTPSMLNLFSKLNDARSFMK